MKTLQLSYRLSNLVVREPQKFSIIQKITRQYTNSSFLVIKIMFKITKVMIGLTEIKNINLVFNKFLNFSWKEPWTHPAKSLVITPDSIRSTIARSTVPQNLIRSGLLSRRPRWARPLKFDHLTNSAKIYLHAVEIWNFKGNWKTLTESRHKLRPQGSSRFYFLFDVRDNAELQYREQPPLQQSKK